MTSHLLRGLLKLPAPFRGKPRIAALFSPLLMMCDELVKVYAHIERERDVEQCDRRNLEILARLVGEPSNPDDTEVLRTLVKVRGLVNASDGSRETLKAIVVKLFGAGTTYYLLLQPKYLQIRIPAARLPTSTSMTSAQICGLCLAALQDAADPGLMIELFFYAPTAGEYPGTLGTDYLPLVFRAA